MGFLTRTFERRDFQISQKLIEAFRGGTLTASGVPVTPEGALKYIAVFACVRILAEGVASLPLHLYRRLQPRGKERTQGHPLYRLLHNAPNPEMTSMTFREAMQGHLALRGNAYAEIVRDGSGMVRELWPLRPDKTTPERARDGRLVYRVELPDSVDPGRRATPLEEGGWAIWLPAANVLHLRGLGGNGIVGYSPITLARQAIGLGLAAEEFGARFFGNDARPGVVLRHPAQLSVDAHKRLRESWEARHQGLDKSHRIAILEEGMELQEIGLAPEDAQFLETRRFQVIEIARLFRIPPHMLADLERATFSNIEHQSLEFVIHTLGPWLVRWEQQIWMDLIPPDEQAELFAEHLVEGLLRGDIASRYAAYATARQWGWMSANDVRERENLNPIPGGDAYLIPLNMMPASAAGPPAVAGGESQRGLPWPAPRRARRSARARHRLASRQQQVFERVASRLVRREVRDVRGEARKLLGERLMDEFMGWLREYYAEVPGRVAEGFGPTMTAYSELVTAAAADEVGADPEAVRSEVATFLPVYLEYLGIRHAQSSQRQLETVVQEAARAGEDPAAAVEQRLDEWDEKRAGKIGLREAIRASNAIALTVYKAVGVMRKRWIAFGDNCPYCTALNGRVVEIARDFLPSGADFEPEGAERPLTVTTNVGHPPAHAGCDCMVVAD